MKLQNACIELASTKSAALGRTLPLLMNLSDQSVTVPSGDPFVEGLMARFLYRLTKVLALWIFCCTRGFRLWSGLYCLWRTYRFFELRRASWSGNYELHLGWLRPRIPNLRYPLDYCPRRRQRHPKILRNRWKQPLWFPIPLSLFSIPQTHPPTHQATCRRNKRVSHPSPLYLMTKHQSKTPLRRRTQHRLRSNSARDQLRCLNLPNPLHLGTLSLSSMTKTKKRSRASIWTQIRIRGCNHARCISLVCMCVVVSINSPITRP